MSKVDVSNTPTTILTQIGIASVLPKIARGENKNFGLNQKHTNSGKTSQKPSNVGDPNKR